ncbi:MAG: response regulator transcription factor [Mameliella sp.]|nr:response regulator transcription factor [Phaeodactylibacter sp.]
MIQAIIIEDEDYAVERLKMLLEETTDKVKIISVLNSSKQAVKWLSVNKADLIFLDINLSDGNAFKIFDQVEVRTPIIFTTAYHEYALRAFEQVSIDYLLKPISREKLKNSIAKYKLLRQTEMQESGPELQQLIDLMRTEKKPKRFMVQVGNKVKIINAPEVAFFSFDAKTTFIHTLQGKRYPIDSSLKQLQLSLPPQDFFRVNRQYLVSRHAVQELQYYSATRIKVYLSVEPEEDIFVARDKIGIFKKWLSE